MGRGYPRPSDGEVLEPGYAGLGASGETAPGVMLMKTDGSVDTAFGTAGVTIVLPSTNTADGGSGDAFTAVTTMADGRILLAGEVGPAGPNNVHSVMTARLLPDGMIDTSYGTNGKAFFQPTGQRFTPRDIAVRADGTMVILGDRDSGLSVAALDAAGTLLQTFGTGGVFDAAVTSNSNPIIDVQPGTGRILFAFVSGQSPTIPATVGIEALTPNGAPDPSYGVNGLATWRFPMSAAMSAFYLRADGVATLVGQANRTYSINDIALVQFTPDGHLDSNFGTDGVAVVPTPNTDSLSPDTSIVYDYGVQRGTAGSYLVYTHTGASIAEFYVGRGGQEAVTRIQAFGEVDLSYGTLGSTTPFTSPGWTPEQPIGTAPMLPHSLQTSGTPTGGGVVLDASTGTLSPAGTVPFFPLFAGSVRTATADINGDGVPDLIGGAGPSGGPHVIVIDGKTHFRMAEFFAFEKAFHGGVFVAAGDINGDGMADLVVTPDQGGGPVVAVYDGAKLAAGFNNEAQIARFFGIDDPDFRGGARASVGDVSGDGKDDLLISAGYLGGPREALYDGAGLQTVGVPPKLVPDFFAFEDTLRNGAFVSMGDLTGDGRADLVFGGGPGGASRVRLFDGVKLLAAGSFQSLDEIPAAQSANFYAAGDSSRGGIHVAVGTVNGKESLITGSGENDPALVQVFSTRNLLGSPNPAPDQTLNVFGGAQLAQGVFVG
jgi:uncharacterized delta-60 repeat protein